MHNIIVAGIGTEVGKTVVSAILTTLLEADYWKPIECGEEGQSDSTTIANWINPHKHHIYPPAYSFKHPLSPHHAARLENRHIEYTTIHPPHTKRNLIIEGVGGIYVPLNHAITTLELFKTWRFSWIIVSKHYLGSINHTLMTLDLLKRHHISILGLIFNGEPNSDSEDAILQLSKVPFIGRLLPEQIINQKTIQRYAIQWRQSLLSMIS